MSEKLFIRQAFQPPGMGWALIFSIGFIFVSFAFAWWAIGPVDAAYFVLTEYGWPEGSDKKPEHPVAQKISLTARYLTFLPPLVSLFWGVGRRGLRKIESSRLLEGHTVVCGLGWQGRAFIKSLHSREKRVVAIELTADEPVEKFCTKKNASLIYGNADDEDVLISAGVPRASEVFICTGSQDQNLSIAQCIGELMVNAVERKKNPLQVHVSLGELPIDDVDTDRLFFPLLPSSDHCHFVLYDPDRRMARCFYYRHKVYQWADEAYATRRWLAAIHGQTCDEKHYRVHLVFLGYTRLIGELILQYARIWPSANQLPPYFTVVCEDPTEAQAFLLQNPCLKEQDDDTELNPGNLFIIDRSSCQSLLDKDVMESVSDKAPVTAVICSAESVSESLQQASYCKMLGRRLGIWQVPVFADLEEQQGTDGLLEVGETQPFAQDRVISFGSSLHYCDTGLLSYADGLAKAIHDSYFEINSKTNPSESAYGQDTLPAFRPWSRLDQSYQRSNYRAADAALLKLYSAGYRWNSVTPRARITDFADDEDVLSRAEHRSWLNEKLLDHWQFGKRDERLKKHPSIVQWVDVDDENRKKDRDQIDTLRAQFDIGKPNAGKPFTIGLVGPSKITKCEAVKVARKLECMLKQIDELQQTEYPFWLELVSPLAPGGDMVLVKRVVQRLKTKLYPIAGFRLLIPGGVDWDVMDRAFRGNWEQGIQWLYRQKDYNHNGTEAEWIAFRDKVDSERRNIFTEVTEAGYQVDVVDLKTISENVDLNSSSATDGYSLNSRWIVEKCDVLIGIPADDDKHVPGDYFDGSACEAIAQWQQQGRERLLVIDPAAK